MDNEVAIRGGRPTDYSPDYCEMVTEWGKAGKSMAWMASQLGVHKDTLYEWIKKHPRFSDAIKVSRSHSQAWWEDQGQFGLFMPHQGGTFNATVWAKNMNCRFPDDWRDKSETAITGAIEVTSIVRKVVDPAKK